MSSRRLEVAGLLGTVWADLDQLLTALPAGDWDTTVLPGWDVHDTLAHIVGTERMLEQGPDSMRERVAAATLGEGVKWHVRNVIGQTNEAWVDALRPLTHEELLAEFRAVTARRSAFLRTMSDEEFEADSWTPGGQRPYGGFMRIRIFDCWMHEQDIRHAIGRPGGEGGPVAEECLAEVRAALGFIIGKQAGAPEGSSVTIALDGPVTAQLHVAVEGRAKVKEALDAPATATLRLSSALFMRLVGGRIEPHAARPQVVIEGDQALGTKVLENLAFTV
jgi:uncharacterized protein (TIGR03083 family)